MNNKFFVTVVLVLSIVLQSFVASASSTESHSVDIEHIQTEHNHVDDINMNDIPEGGHDISDCHHCGHCSSSHLPWISAKSISNHTTFKSVQTISYQKLLSEDVFDVVFRPPIS